MSRSAFRRFIGVDLGGGRGKNTAVARVELTKTAKGEIRLGVAEAKTRYGHRGTGLGDEPEGDALFRDDVLLEYLDRWVDETTVVAINAPLSLPPCVRCRLPCPSVARCEVPVVQWMRTWAPKITARGRSDRHKPPVTPYTQRATELLWAAAGVRPRETLGQGTGPLAARAAYLRRVASPWLRLHENLLEVHPRATVVRLFGEETDRAARTGETEAMWRTRKHILDRLGQATIGGVAFDYVWPEVVVRNAHVFYAVMCAYTGFLWSRQQWTGPEEIEVAGRSEESGDVPVLRAAAEALGDLWVEDGWIWAPPLSRHR